MTASVERTGYRRSFGTYRPSLVIQIQITDKHGIASGFLFHPSGQLRRFPYIIFPICGFAGRRIRSTVPNHRRQDRRIRTPFQRNALIHVHLIDPILHLDGIRQALRRTLVVNRGGTAQIQDIFTGRTQLCRILDIGVGLRLIVAVNPRILHRDHVICGTGPVAVLLADHDSREYLGRARERITPDQLGAVRHVDNASPVAPQVERTASVQARVVHVHFEFIAVLRGVENVKYAFDNRFILQSNDDIAGMGTDADTARVEHFLKRRILLRGVSDVARIAASRLRAYVGIVQRHAANTRSVLRTVDIDTPLVGFRNDQVRILHQQGQIIITGGQDRAIPRGIDIGLVLANRYPVQHDIDIVGREGDAVTGRRIDRQVAQLGIGRNFQRCGEGGSLGIESRNGLFDQQIIVPALVVGQGAVEIGLRSHAADELIRIAPDLGHIVHDTVDFNVALAQGQVFNRNVTRHDQRAGGRNRIYGAVMPTVEGYGRIGHIERHGMSFGHRNRQVFGSISRSLESDRGP